MSSSTNKQIVLDYINNVINNCDIDKMNEYLADNYTEVHGNLRETIGPEIAKERLLGIYKTMPDFHIIVERQIAEGDWVATSCQITGTHKGIWMNMKPTGKRLEYALVSVDKVVGEKIVEHGGAASNFEAFLAVGAVKIVEIDD